MTKVNYNVNIPFLKSIIRLSSSSLVVFDNKLAFQRFKSYTYMAYEGKE